MPLLKTAAQYILGGIIGIIALIFAFMLFDAVKSHAHFVHLMRESIPEVQLGFFAAMIFAGLYIINILVRLVTCQK